MSLRGEYASIMDRILAHIVDLVIVALVMLIVGLLLFMSAVLTLGLFWLVRARPLLLIWHPFNLLGWLVMIGYFTFFEGTTGQTPGKRILNIMVVKEGGKPCDLTSAFVRNIGRILDFLPGFYIVGILLILFTEKKQRIGDMVAGTVVVKASPRIPAVRYPAAPA